ncbi:MAG: hypothetical protein WAM82_12625 [Thermoanaerobaculia bacterium]
MLKIICRLDPSILAGLLIAALLFDAGCASRSATGPVQPPRPAQPAASAGLLAALCPLNAPALSSEIPGDSPLLGQAPFDCFAWQEFIALNWPAAAQAGQAAPVDASRFGEPGETRPVVWETYMDVHGVMREGAQTPMAWGQSSPLPPACTQRRASEDRKVLRMTAKFRVDIEAPEDLAEAAPTQRPNWLADRDGNLVWYEILIDKPEYDYIVQTTGFYNADTQYQKVSQGTHVDLPRGVYRGPHEKGRQGAMELKAAWLRVQDPTAEKWRRYKLSRALVYDPRHDTCAAATLALVGLHILHKTETQPQWTWATFEHVDNAPDRSQASTAGDRYTFYRSACQPLPIPAHCRAHKSQGCAPPPAGITQTSCEPNTAPAYCLKLDGPSEQQCPPYPIQVVRELPIPDSNDNPVRRLNSGVQEMIRKANPDSVWQYYQLVNVLWSDSAVDENLAPKPPVTPLSESGLRPSPPSFPSSNAVMETYVQTTTCVDCHRSATTAKSAQDPKPLFASDYSFLLGMAKSPRRSP